MRKTDSKRTSKAKAETLARRQVRRIKYATTEVGK